MADNRPLVYAGAGAAFALLIASIYYTGKDIEKEEHPKEHKSKITHDHEILCTHEI